MISGMSAYGTLDMDLCAARFCFDPKRTLRIATVC